jgi:hypothetical protein
MSYKLDGENKFKCGLYYGYTENEGGRIDSAGRFVKTRSKVPSELQINEDGTFSILHIDVSFIRPNKPTDFYAKGTWRISSDTLILNSKYLNKDFVTVVEKKIENCNENFMRFRISYGFDTLQYRIYPNVSMDLSRSTVDFEDNQYYYYRKEHLATLRLSRSNMTIMKWKYPIRDTSSNSFDISLKSEIDKQNIVIEEEKFIVKMGELIPLNYKTLKIDKFNHVVR